MRKSWKLHKLTWSNVHDVNELCNAVHLTVVALLPWMAKLTFLIWLLINFGNPNHPKSKITTNAVPEPIATFRESFIFVERAGFRSFKKANTPKNKNTSFKTCPRFIHGCSENVEDLVRQWRLDGNWWHDSSQYSVINYKRWAEAEIPHTLRMAFVCIVFSLIIRWWV